MAQSLCADDHFLLNRGNAFLLNGCQVVKVLAHHLCHKLYPWQVLNLIFPHQGPVSQDRNPVAYRIYLLQEMGYKDATDPLIPQLSHQHKQLFHLAVIQG